MLIKILSSNWVAIPVLAIACVSLVLLYLRGRTTEAKLGASLLLLAFLLIIWGRKPPPDTDVRD